MTRKRFVKQLMSYGASRNDAVKEAASLPHGGSYDGYFAWARLGLAIDRLSSAMNSSGISMTQIASALWGFGQEIHKELPECTGRTPGDDQC